MLQWARENKISEGAVDRLFEEGFTSLEALRLLDEEDLSKSKIPRGQKKLILACVRGLEKNDEHQQSGVNRVAQMNSTERMRVQSLESTQTNQSAAAGRHMMWKIATPRVDSTNQIIMCRDWLIS